MTYNTKVTLAIIGDILLLVVFAYIPLLWLKVLLMSLVSIDLMMGIKRHVLYTPKHLELNDDEDVDTFHYLWDEE